MRMDSNFSQLKGIDPKDLEEYIRQIKSFEAQMKTIEASAKEEEELKKNRPIYKLVLWTGIAGLRYYIDRDSDEGKKILKSLKPGTELQLLRDPQNKYDRWAIAVYTPDGIQVGHVTRYKNETIARLMDYGVVFHAYVESRKDANYKVPDTQRVFVEDFTIPFSIWME